MSRYLVNYTVRESHRGYIYEVEEFKIVSVNKSNKLNELLNLTSKVQEMEHNKDITINYQQKIA